jgi:hypothetical protein
MQYPSPADIAEMKARGFDSATIAEAEQQSQRWVSAQQVCHVIEAAFAGVTLCRGIGLQEAQGLDDYADAATCASYRADDKKDDWHRITPEALNRCNSSLSFFDAEGMRFHLPAYLLADLHGDYHFGMAFCLTHLGDRNISQFALLSPEQRAAVRAFLLHIADEPDYEFERPHIVCALNEYWSDASSESRESILTSGHQIHNLF